MIPEKDIWLAAILMLRRYGDKALEETATRADQLEAWRVADGTTAQKGNGRDTCSIRKIARSVK